MSRLAWFERKFTFGIDPRLLPFLVERLRGTIARVESKVRDVPDAALSTRHEGKWSVKEIIAHLAEVDEIAFKRIEEIKRGVSPMSPAVIQPSRDYNSWPIADVIAYFADSRTRNVSQYDQLDPSDLQKTSRHPRLGVMMNPVDLAWFDAEHDDHHLVRVGEIIAALKTE